MVIQIDKIIRAKPMEYILFGIKCLSLLYQSISAKKVARNCFLAL